MSQNCPESTTVLVLAFVARIVAQVVEEPGASEGAHGYVERLEDLLRGRVHPQVFDLVVLDLLGLLLLAFVPELRTGDLLLRAMAKQREAEAADAARQPAAARCENS